MSKRLEGRRTHGSFADLVGPRADVIKKTCAICGYHLNDRRKTYCGPCYDVRLEVTIARNRAKNKAA